MLMMEGSNDEMKRNKENNYNKEKEYSTVEEADWLNRKQKGRKQEEKQLPLSA